MTKFKIGDKVKCLKNYPKQFTKDKIYEIIESSNLLCYIKADDLGTYNSWVADNFELVSHAPAFLKGDIVEACGIRGVVDFVNPDTDSRFPVNVTFDNEENDFFTAEGKTLPWHKEPTLKLVERPAPPTEVTFETTILNWDGATAAATDKNLKPFLGKQVIVTVKLK